MKKITAICLAGILAAGLTSCSSTLSTEETCARFDESTKDLASGALQDETKRREVAEQLSEIAKQAPGELKDATRSLSEIMSMSNEDAKNISDETGEEFTKALNTITAACPGS